MAFYFVGTLTPAHFWTSHLIIRYWLPGGREGGREGGEVNEGETVAPAHFWTSHIR